MTGLGLMTNVTVCSAAEVDYTESLCWYAEHSTDTANSFEQEFDEAILQIANAPDRYPKCDERHRFYLMRRFPFQIISFFCGHRFPGIV